MWEDDHQVSENGDFKFIIAVELWWPDAKLAWCRMMQHRGHMQSNLSAHRNFRYGWNE